MWEVTPLCGGQACTSGERLVLVGHLGGVRHQRGRLPTGPPSASGARDLLEAISLTSSRGAHTRNVHRMSVARLTLLLIRAGRALRACQA